MRPSPNIFFAAMLASLLPGIARASATSHSEAVIDRLEASVNSDLILLSDIEKFRKTEKLRAQLDPLFANTPVAKHGLNATDTDIVDFLIDEKLIANQFPVSDADVEQAINEIQANNHIDRATLKNALAEQGFTFDEYFEMIRQSTSKRNLIDRDIRIKVNITDDDVKNYYFNHYVPDNSGPRSYALKIISVSVKNYKSASAARKSAGTALAELRHGESFEEVARRYSDDPSGQTGGDLGLVSEDQLAPVIRDQLKSLRIGQISDIFGSRKTGYYIIKLDDVKTNDSNRYNELKEQIKSQLASAEYQRQIGLWLERRRQSAFIHRAGQSLSQSIPITHQ